MIFTIYGKKITSQGSKSEFFFTKYGQKITSQGSKHYVIRLRISRIKHLSYAYSCINQLFPLPIAVSGLGPVIYAEVQFDDKFDIHNHGWSIIFAWIGACCLALSFILSFVLMFNGPQETHPKEIMRSDSTYPLPM